jgi:hypothetical protein
MDQIMAAYRSGTAALQSIHARPELQPETIDATLADVQSALDVQTEIDDPLAAAATVAAESQGIDSAEIEAELDALLAEQSPDAQSEESAVQNDGPMPSASLSAEDLQHLQELERQMQRLPDLPRAASKQEEPLLN